MREVVLYIAMSLDGYVADETGGADWLEGHGEGPEGADSYSRFIQEVDTVIMGRNTYRQVTTQLSPERWVYQGLHTYVVTHRPLPSTQDITFTAEHPCALMSPSAAGTRKIHLDLRRPLHPLPPDGGRPHRPLPHLCHPHHPGLRHSSVRGAGGGAKAAPFKYPGQ